MSNKHDNILNIYNQKLKYLNYSNNTIKIYSHYTYEFLKAINKYHQHLTSFDFQNYLDNYKFSSISQQNQIINAIKFLYETVLDKKYDKINFDRPRKEDKLPDVIPEEYLKLQLSKIRNAKHLAILSLAYSVALRSSDVLNLKVSDIDSQNMQIKINQGKGNKDAYLPLTNTMLVLLKDYYREYLPKEYLFEGQSRSQYSATSLNMLVKKYFGKKYHFHNIRHSTATHLLNKGVDISFIQKLLRNADVKTTMVYLKITTRDLNNLPLY